MVKVEEIMEEVQEEIRTRKEMYPYTLRVLNEKYNPLAAEEGHLEHLKNVNENYGMVAHDDPDYPELRQINELWDTLPEFQPISHKPIIGALINLLHRMAFRVAMRYLNLVFKKQREFNAHLVRLQNQYRIRADHQIRFYAELVRHQNRNRKVFERQEEFNSYLVEYSNEVEARLNLLESRLKHLELKVNTR
ncbi:MAG: hypothetical protein A3G93_07175 [Nitrospinae bacterium RIFCSPLOWO2_12_FULL_45_22]|nr:MAG: hypothetical protein A3G93_07175 [Nitrospinae bacterium RIFCSPLOWO2_12_FULL_45_22]